MNRNLLGGSSSSSNNSTSQTSNNNNDNNSNVNDLQLNQQQNESSTISSQLADEDSPILARYTTSSKLSENANNLMERKRNLILESKRLVFNIFYESIPVQVSFKHTYVIYINFTYIKYSL